MAMYSIYVFVIYYVSLIYFLILCIPDKARVVFTPTVQYIPRGLKGIIKCQTSANPPIKYITWTKDNRLFQPFKTAGIEALLNGSLLIDQVKNSVHIENPRETLCICKYISTKQSVILKGSLPQSLIRKNYDFLWKKKYFSRIQIL